MSDIEVEELEFSDLEKFQENLFQLVHCATLCLPPLDILNALYETAASIHCEMGDPWSTVKSLIRVKYNHLKALYKDVGNFGRNRDKFEEEEDDNEEEERQLFTSIRKN